MATPLRLPLPVTLFLVAAALRLLAFAIFYFGSVIAGYHGQVDPFDSVTYDKLAWFAADHFRAGQWIDLRVSTVGGGWDVGFTYVVAFEYTVVGHHPEVARIINCLIASFTAPATYLAAQNTSLGERVARRAGWLVAVWPLSLYWTGFDLLKDPLVWFFVAVTLLAIVTTAWRRTLALSAIAFGCIYVVRDYMGALVAFTLVLAKVLKRDGLGLVAVMVAVLVVQAALLAAGWPGTWKLVPASGGGGAISSETATTTTVCGGLGSQSGVGSLVGSQCVAPLTLAPTSLAARFIVGIPVAVFGPGLKPLADFTHPTIDWGMYPGLLLWMLLVPFTALGLWRLMHRRDASAMALALFALIIWAAIALIYAGHALRQREMAFPATLILTSLGLERPWPRYWAWVNGGYWVIALGALSWEAGFI